MSDSWNNTNKTLESLKKNPALRFLYKLSWAPQVYHFSLALLGAIIYGFPSRKIKVIGITGTKGKTTTVELINAILEAAGKKTAVLSSLRVKIGGKSDKNLFGNTMPGRFFVQSFFKEAVKAGCEYAILEVTSQGVALSRHRFIKWRSAAITNLAPEHIESHGSFENYRAAKLAFLQKAARMKAPVFLNASNEHYDFFLKALAGEKIISFSKDEAERFGAENPVLRSDFYKENMALAYKVTRELGVPEEAVNKALAEFKGVPGRFEFVQKEPFAVVVDYAHTPDSLEAIYRAVRPEEVFERPGKPWPGRPWPGRPWPGRLIAVLGSAGGGRDKWKRPKMGAIAAQYCEIVILTSEDPFDEDDREIIKELRSGLADAKNSRLKPVNVFEILDRKEAIKKAIALARPGDCVVMTGKGSEAYIRMAGGKKIPWDERGVAADLLNKK